MLSVPDTKDRYYVFSMMNMWTDVFGSVGKRTTGTGSRQLPDCRAELARHSAGGHQADLPLVDTVCVGPRADAGERAR